MLLGSLLSSYNFSYKDDEGHKHYDYSDVWTGFAKDSLQSVLLWVAVALAVLLIAVGIFVRYKKRESLKSYLTASISLAVGFAATVIVTMLALEFYEMHEKNYVFDLVLYPTIVLAATVLLGAAAIYVSSLYSRKAFKITAITAASVMGAALVALLVCLGVYLSSGQAEYNNEVEITVTENALLYVCAAGLIGVLAFFAFFFGRKDKNGFDSKSISYASICIAISFALSYLRPVHLPQGGSITIASLLPLMVYSYMFGTKKGVFAGMIYGILQAIQDPWIVHPAQFLLDYPIAFAGIGVAGMFANVKKLEKLPQIQFALGAVVAGVLRYLSHILSGVFAFSEYAYDAAGNAMSPWVYSLSYNSVVMIDIAIVIAVGAIVFSSRAFVKEARHIRATVRKKQEEQSTEEPQE